MSFTNVAVDLRSLPRFEEAPLEPLDPRYPRVLLALAVAIETPALIAALLIVLLVPPLPAAVRVVLAAAVLAALAGIAWYVYRSAASIRYGVRRHDVIRRSGVFWVKEIVQPLRRIQHIEQTQGPLDKRLGFWTLKLYSAGSGDVTLTIPGLDADTARALTRHVLSFQEPASTDGSGPPGEARSDLADDARG